MVAIFTSASVWVLLSSCQCTGAATSDETYMLQNTGTASLHAEREETCMLQSPVSASSRAERMNTLLQRTSLSAEERTELAEMERIHVPVGSYSELPRRAHGHGAERAPRMLLETASAVESDIETTYESFQQPTVWGPAAWFFLHSIALAQGDEIEADKQERLRRFFTEDLPFLLPCPACTRNVQEHVSAMEIDDDTFADRDSVFEFVWGLHNMVNSDTGVPDVPWEEAVLDYAQVFDQGVTDLHFEGVTHVSADEE